MHRARFALLLTLTATPACLLLSDLDRLDSAADGPPQGAAEGGPDERHADGEAEADVPDPRTDAPSCGDAICEDFDDDAALSRWVLTRGGKTLPLFGVDERSSTTPLRSFFYEAVEPLEYDTKTSLSKVVSVGEAGGLRCTFDLRFDALDGSFPIVFEIGVTGVESGPAIQLEEMEGNLRIAEEPGGVRTETDLTLAPGAWTKITATLQRSPALVFTVTDGFHTKTMAPQPWPAATDLHASFGLVFSRFATNERKGVVRFDTIRCTVL